MISTSLESKVSATEVIPKPVLAEVGTKAIAPRDEQRSASEKNVADLLYQGGIAQSILQGACFHLCVENEPYMPLTLDREQDQLVLTRHKVKTGQRHIDIEMRFQVSANGVLRHTETIKSKRPKGETRGRSAELALTFSQDLIAQGFAEAIARTAQPSAVPSHQEPALEVSESQAPEATEPQVSAPQTFQPPEPQPEAQPTEAEAVEPPPEVQKDIVEAVEPAPPQMPLSEMSQPTSPPPVPAPATVDQAVTAEQVQSWSMIAQALSKPDDYQARVEQVTAAYRSGIPLPEQAEAALKQALAQYRHTLNNVKEWYRLSREQGAPQNYLDKIREVGQGLKTGQPLSEGALAAMQKDFRRADWVQLSQGVTEATPDRQTARVALRALQQGEKPDDVLKILEFDPSYRLIHSQHGPVPAQMYKQTALDFAMKVYHQATQQSSMSQRTPQPSQRRGLSR
jgi:outer membrane biosynthesis protein TonB